MEDKHNQILLALRRIVEEVTAQTDMNRALEILTVRIREVTGSDCCSLYLADPRQKFLRLAATDGLDRAAVGKASLNVGEGLVGLVGKTRRLINLADAPAHPAFKYLPEVGEDEFYSFLGAPVILRDDLLGVLVIQSKSRITFGALEESFLVTLAAQVASGIAARRLMLADDGSLRLRGQIGTGSVAIARALVWQPPLDLEDIREVKAEDPQLQQELVRQAVYQLQTVMDRAQLRMRENSKSEAALSYMSGYGRLLEDGQFAEEIIAEIEAREVTATSAVKNVIQRRLESLSGQGRAAEARDLKDFAMVLLWQLTQDYSRPEPDQQVILVARHLPVASVTELQHFKVVGFVSLSTDTSAHTAIMARDLGIPSVIGLNADPASLDGRLLIVDGAHRQVLVDPSPALLGEYRQVQSQSQEQSSLYSAEKYEPGVTVDGHRIRVGLNAGLNHAEDPSLPRQTDGVGLFRSEIYFMLGKAFPSEDLQTEWYCKLLERYRPLPVRVRTLDVGGEKSLSYMPITEVNPALGWRGVRVSLDQPQILRVQLRALLRAQQKYGNLEIMLPMVSRIEEVAQVREILRDARDEVAAATGAEVIMPKFGVMVEVPCVAYMMQDMAPLCDFFSIGSNDLMQYLLAVDRSNPKVGAFFDPFHPAVVRCLERLFEEAQRAGRSIAVCGEIAGSPLGALMLLSLGYSELSMNYSELGRIRYMVRRIVLDDLQKLKPKALGITDAAELRKLYSDYALSCGLGRIIDMPAQTETSGQNNS